MRYKVVLFFFRPPMTGEFSKEAIDFSEIVRIPSGAYDIIIMCFTLGEKESEMFMNTRKRSLAAVLMAAILLLSFAACSSAKVDTGNSSTNNSSVPDSSKENSQADAVSTEDSSLPEESGEPEEDPEKGIKITQTAAKAAQLEKYETADFSMMIPQGWNVTTGGAYINTYIGVTDPNDTRNTMFVALKMEPLLHCQEGKDAWQTLYNNGDTMVALFAQAPVLEDPSTEGFYKIMYPDFTVTERFEATNGYGVFALGDEILRATFSDPAGEAEGLFTASIVDFGSFAISDGTLIGYQLQTVDGGYYMAYDVIGITAAKDTLIEWADVLSQCLNSLQFSQSFIDATLQASDDQLALSRQISQNFNETMDGLMDSWEKRNRSWDIMSQKQSDAILGYERVYDTETNEIYRATNGFTDVYDGQRYQSVTDDNMYGEAISGYIEKMD